MADFGPLGGVKITGFISPTDTNDLYAVIDPLYGIDGLRNVTGGTAGLNSIPVLRRRAGMIVGINDGAQYYKLNPSPWGYTIADWTQLDFSGGTDTFITGMTFNAGNYDLTIHRNDAIDFTQSLSILSGDMVVTGGTYNINTGIVTFTNNSGGTFNVSGFTSGMTDSYTTTAYTVGNELRFDNNVQGTNFYNVNLSGFSETLAQTLVLGNTTSGTDIFVTSGDVITTNSGAFINLHDSAPNRVNIANDISNSAEIILQDSLTYWAGKDYIGDQATFAISRVGTYNGSGWGLVMGSNDGTNFKGFNEFNSYGSKAIQIGSRGSVHLLGITGTVITGGQNITASTSNTLYVPNLNINYTPLNNDALTQVLVRDTDGTVRYRTAASLAGASSGNTFTSGVTLNGTVLDFNRNDLLSAYTVDLSSLLTGTTTFSGLTDTVVTSPLNGDYLVYSGNNVINVTEKDIYFTASTSGQTVFNALTVAPINNEKSLFFVNGVKQRYGATHDYVITGGTDVVWVSNKHIIDTIDELEIIYL